MTDNLHTVTAMIEDGDDETTVEFHCAGDETSPCHQYPDCECEDWGNECIHLAVPHAECWMQWWFDNDMVAYIGHEYGDEKPTVAGAGPIEWESYGYDGIDWKWVGDRS